MLSCPCSSVNRFDTAIKLASKNPSTEKEKPVTQKTRIEFSLCLSKVKPIPLNMCPRVNVTHRELEANVPLVVSWPAAVSLLLQYLPSSLLTCAVAVKWIHGGVSQRAPLVQNKGDLYTFTAARQR